MSVIKLARPEIAALSPYEAAAQVDDTVRLNANESPVAQRRRRPVSPTAESLPRGSSRGNLQQLPGRTRFGCAENELLVTRGSSEAIDLLIRTFCQRGRRFSIVTSSPSFSMYRHYAKVQGARIYEVPATQTTRSASTSQPLDAACDDTTRLLFVCSPNNPTGSVLSAEQLTDLLRRREERSVVVVDEAYIEFASVPSAVDLLQQHSNLVVLRTLSKALGFAGVRCGVAIGNAETVSLLNAVQAPYAIATPVVECVEDALHSASIEQAAAFVAEIVAERERVTTVLARLPFIEEIWPSQANFFLMRCSNADAIVNHCASQRVLLRNLNNELANCVRVSIGARAENDRLIDALQTFRESRQ